MTIVAMLSVTGVFEWMAVRLVWVSSKESEEIGTAETSDIRIVSMFKLTIAMGLFPFFLSAFLSNVTLMLLVSPVSVGVCEMLVGAPDESDTKGGHGGGHDKNDTAHDEE